MEVIVDSLCLKFERGTDPCKVWEAMSKGTLAVLFCGASWHGMIMAMVAFSERDDFSSCLGANMCLCVNNGLVQGDYREAYCFSIYPNGNWSAPTPILGSRIIP